MLDEQSMPRKWHSKLIILPFAVIVLIALAVYLGVLIRSELKEYDYIGKSPEFQDRVTIEGMGKVTATPDIALVNVGLVTQKNDVASAQTENTQKMNDIIRRLKTDHRIADEDIQTSQYTINPRYDWSNNRQTIIGYSVEQSVSIKVRDFDQVGDIIAMAGSLGANSVSGPSFTIDDPEVYREQARQEAIAQAKAKAETLADQVGIKLGSIVNFSEYTNSPVYPYDSYAKAELAVGRGGATPDVAPVIEAGSQEVVVNVSISYEIL